MYPNEGELVTGHTRPKSDSTPFITKQALGSIRADIAVTIRPSWQAHLPENFGSAEHGKLKADQFRTAYEFDIPVSLVALLDAHRETRKVIGNHSVDEDNNAQRIVDNTLDIAMSLPWALSHRTSTFHQDQYTLHMTRYIRGIQSLYPDFNLRPNHHYALHIPDILAGFGPLRGTWAMPLERLIGRVQDLNTNSKIGPSSSIVYLTASNSLLSH